MPTPSVPPPARRAMVNESRRQMLGVELDGYHVAYDFDDADCTATVHVMRPGEATYDLWADMRNHRGERVICADIECGGTPADIEVDVVENAADRATVLALTTEALTLFYDAEPVGSPHRKVLRMFYRRAAKAAFMATAPA